MTLEGRVALVTGGSGSLGSAICHELAGRGASLWVHYGQRAEVAQALVDSLPTSAGAVHRTLGLDLTDAEAVQRGLQQVVETSGRLDVLVNNAGVYLRLAMEDASYDAFQHQWQRTLDLNLTAPANACHCAAVHMRRQGGGRIINISSRGAFRGEPTNPAYGASKAGLNALSQSLAVALAPHGIEVFAVAPGFVDSALDRDYMTPDLAQSLRHQSPMGRLATPYDVAYWVGCLTEDAAAFASGTIIDVNGASHLRT